MGPFQVDIPSSPPPAKQWNQSFSSEQRDTVAALPPVSATREGMLSLGLAVAELVVTRARPLYPATTVVGPTTWLKWPPIDLKESSDWLSAAGCISRRQNQPPIYSYGRCKPISTTLIRS